MELPQLSNFVDVEIWDLSQLLHAKWTSAVKQNYVSKATVKKFHSLNEFFKFVKTFIDNNRSLNVCVYNAIPTSNFLELFVNNFLSTKLKKTNFKVIDFKNPGIPLQNLSRPQKKLSISILLLLNKYRYSTGIKHFFKTLRIYFFSSINKFFPKFLTHLLVAGDKYFDYFSTSIKSSVEIINCCTFDMSEFLRKQKDSHSIYNSGVPKWIVYLDTNDPYYEGDGKFEGSKPILSSEIWYPLLNDFFSRIEILFNIPVIICGHPKTNFKSPSKIFGNRIVVYGEVYERVSQASFVISRHSTSVSFPILFHKPVIFIISDEMKNKKAGENYVKETEFLASTLDSKTFNINNFNDQELLQILSSEMIIDSKLYSEYIANYLTAKSNSQPNFEIILKQVLGINSN